jgi:hypothetical protein
MSIVVHDADGCVRVEEQDVLATPLVYFIGQHLLKIVLKIVL